MSATMGLAVNAESSPAIAFRTLLAKEMLRFWKVSFQTVAAPVLTAVLYLLVFGQVLAEHVEAFPGVSYVSFLIPGLVMMSVLQNAFANSSSSLIQSKIMGSLVFVLLPPFSHWQLFGAYVLASIGPETATPTTHVIEYSARDPVPWVDIAPFGSDRVARIKHA